MSKKISLKELLTLTMLGALLALGQWVMQGLPNIEPVSLLLMVYAYKFGYKTLISTYVFVGLELLLFGFNVWNIMYLYVWAILVLVVMPFRKIRKAWLFALIGGIFGMSFGTLCSVPYFFAMGPEFAFSWIAGGITFDMIHGIGNFAIILVLYIPLTKALDRIKP